MRNIVMSDTGGWLPQLLNTFDRLGIDAERGLIPEGMRIVHCGDVVHKGPFSSQLLQVIDHLMLNSPGQWIQLMGNHEAQHLPGAPVFWQCDCDIHDVSILGRWQRDNLMQPTFGLTLDSAVTLLDERVEKAGSIFFSHGGLTRGFWTRNAAGALDAARVAEELNRMPMHEITVPGLMLGEQRPTSRIGPVWAVGNTEVFDSWRDEPEQAMPFVQFHGHTTSYSFDRRSWWPGLEDFRKSTSLIESSRTVVTDLNNNLMLGVDPGFSGAPPRIDFQPWFEFETQD